MKRAKSGRRPLFEVLEQRAMLAADLAGFTPLGWPGAVYVSNEVNVYDNTVGITATDTIYIGGAYKNVGNSSAFKTITMKFLIDGVTRYTFTDVHTNQDPFSVGETYSTYEIDVGTIKPGVHTMTFSIDTAKANPESDETNNSVSQQFTVLAGDVAKVAFVKQPRPVVAGVTMAPITVKATDAGKFATPGENVTLSVVSGPGVIAGTTVVATDAAGVATFSDISFTVAGTYLLKATGNGIDSTNSIPLKVSAAGLASVEFVQGPQNVVAGVKFGLPVTVRAEDAFGNLLKGQAIKLAAFTAPLGGALIGGTSAVTNASGIATFATNTFKKAGTYTLIASKLLITDLSGPFTVSANVAKKLAFTALPVGVAHGDPATVEISVVDLYGNVVTTSNGGTVNVTVVAKPAGGTPGGDPSEPIANGVASLTNLTFSAAGKWSLKATNSIGLPLVTSAVFTIL